jgi:hypothetical protein
MLIKLSTTTEFASTDELRVFVTDRRIFSESMIRYKIDANLTLLIAKIPFIWLAPYLNYGSLIQDGEDFIYVDTTSTVPEWKKLLPLRYGNLDDLDLINVYNMAKKKDEIKIVEEIENGFLFESQN